MSQLVNFKWPQGEDLNIQLLYKEGSSQGTASAVALQDNYSLRMDIINNATRDVIYTFLSSTQTNSLRTGLDRQPNINIFLPRSLTLPGGAIHALMSTQVLSFGYDIFLRNTVTDRQFKMLRGSISIEKSATLWP